MRNRTIRDAMAVVLTPCFIGLVLTLAPIDSRFTGGLIGADVACAQSSSDPTTRCVEWWERMVKEAAEECGGPAHCQTACDPSTGDPSGVLSSCICLQVS